jgi:hypothetical protein
MNIIWILKHLNGMSMMMDLFIKKNIFRIALGVAGSWENKK